MVKVIQLTPNMSRGQIHLVLGKYKVREDDFAHVTAHLDSLEALAAEQAQAEVLAACIKLLEDNRYATVAGVLHELHELQPAAKHLEELLWQEREKALLNIIAWRRDLLEAWRTDSRTWMTALLEGGPNMDIEKARAEGKEKP